MKNIKQNELKWNVKDITIITSKSGKTRKLTKLEKIKTLVNMCKKTRKK